MTRRKLMHNPPRDGRWRLPNTLRLSVLALVAALASCNPAGGSSGADAGSGTAVGFEIVGVASVIDGNTLEMYGDQIRLDGVEAPAAGRRCGAVDVHQSATSALSEATVSQTVSCTITNAGGDHGLRTAECRVGNLNLNQHIIAQGWARASFDDPQSAYSEEERRARASSRGVWSLQCPDAWTANNAQSVR
jgi:endonuclease YncB( thermonuclease family)